jgi:hypothetical protein
MGILSTDSVTAMMDIFGSMEPADLAEKTKVSTVFHANAI